MEQNETRKSGLVFWVVIAFAVILIAFPFAKAIGNWYSDHKPWDYPLSTWVCEEPHLILNVRENGQAVCSTGQDDAETYFLDYVGTTVGFIERTEDDRYGKVLARGSGDFSAEKFTVNFSPAVVIPGISEEPIQELVFLRQ